MSPELARAIRTQAGQITGALLFCAVMVPVVWIIWGASYAGYVVLAALLLCLLLWIGASRVWAVLLALVAVMVFANWGYLSRQFVPVAATSPRIASRSSTKPSCSFTLDRNNTCEVASDSGWVFARDAGYALCWNPDPAEVDAFESVEYLDGGGVSHAFVSNLPRQQSVRAFRFRVSQKYLRDHHLTALTMQMYESKEGCATPPVPAKRPCDGVYDCRSSMAFTSDETAPIDKPEHTALICMPPDQQWSRKYSAHLWTKEGVSFKDLGVFPLSIEEDGKQIANRMPEFDRIAFVASVGAEPVETWFVREGRSCVLP